MRKKENGGTKRRPGYVMAGIVIIVIAVLVLILVNIQLNEAKEARRREIIEKYSDRILIYGADDSAPPLRFLDEDGIHKGVVIDLMNQLSLELGLEIRCVPYKWEDALENLKEGETDFCDMFISDERSKYYVFSDPLYNLRTVMVMRQGDEYTLDDIDHLTIATQKGDYANEYLGEHYPNAKLIYVHDIGEALDELTEDKVDAVIGDEPVLLYYAENKRIEDSIAFFGTSLYEEPVVLAVNRGDADLIPVINDAIASLKQTDAMFDFIQIDVEDAVRPAVIGVHGDASALDRVIDGVIYTGINSMLQVIVLALLLFGSINILRQGGGDVKLLTALEKIARGPRSAEYTVSAMVIILSGIMGLNAPAIMAVGNSFAKPLAEKYDISPYRMANVMDAQSNTLAYTMPWTPAIIYTLSFALDTSAPLTGTQIMPCCFHCFTMCIVMAVTTFTGFGRHDDPHTAK